MCPIGFVIVKRNPFLSRVIIILDTSELVEAAIAEVHDFNIKWQNIV
jgi:hypothetical protein